MSAYTRLGVENAERLLALAERAPGRDQTALVRNARQAIDWLAEQNIPVAHLRRRLKRVAA